MRIKTMSVDFGGRDCAAEAPHDSLQKTALHDTKDISSRYKRRLIMLQKTADGDARDIESRHYLNNVVRLP